MSGDERTRTSCTGGGRGNQEPGSKNPPLGKNLSAGRFQHQADQHQDLGTKYGIPRGLAEDSGLSQHKSYYSQPEPLLERKDSGFGQGDSLFQWMRDRQNAFRDFEASFQENKATGTGVFFQRDQFFPTLQNRSYPSELQHTRASTAAPYLTDNVRSHTDMLSTKKPSQDMTPKAKVSYDDTKFQVEFDVQEYKPEELSIKTEGDVLVVLAKHETKSDEKGSSGGSYVSKQFEQRFTLPSGVKPEEITSSLSKGGVLTVTAPREIRKTSIGGFSKSRGALEETFNPQSSQANGDQGLPHPKVKYDDDKFQISLDCKKYKPEELDVKVEGNTIVITAKQEIKEPGGTRTRVFEQKFTLPSGVKAEKVTSKIDRDGVLCITAPRGNASASSINQTIEERMDRVMAPMNWDDFGQDARRQSHSTTTTSRSSTSGNLIPTGGDSLFSDSGFGGERSLFHHSEALDNTDGVSKVQCEDGKYKIIVNVRNYKPEELVIKTVGRSVQVEAKHMEKTSDGHSYSSRNFTQSFSLPSGVNPEEVTSSLNRDGQLVIEAPMPQPQHKISSERLVPIKHH